MKDSSKKKLKMLVEGFSILIFFTIVAIGILAIVFLPNRVEKNTRPNTICIDGYTYFETKFHRDSRTRTDYPLYTILIKDNKPVRCE